MRFLRIPMANLGRRPLRTGLTAFGIAVAVASCLLLTGMSRGTERAWTASLAERGIHVMGIGRWEVDLLTATLDQKVVEDIRRTAGVREVAAELVNLVRLDEKTSVLLRGWEPESFLWESLPLKEGRLPRPGERRVAVVPVGVAGTLGLGAGEALTIQGREFEVVGIARPASLMNNCAVTMPLESLQDLLGRQGKVNEVGVRVNRPDDMEEVAAIQAALNAKLPDMVFLQAGELAADNYVLKVFRALAWATSGIALGIALVVVLNTLVMSVTERTREIGVLAAVGWEPLRVLAMIVVEGLALAVVGGAAGMGAGVLSLKWLVQLPKLRGLIEPEISVGLVWEVMAATLLVGILGSIYPAWRAMRLNPVDALKYE